MKPVRISVIISTRDRAGQLSQCLESLVHQEAAAPDAYEIIVVDNGSTDSTRQVVETAQAQFPRVRYLYEERLGLSIARNAGVRHAAGQVICFTDDDAIPSPEYVSEILASFEDPRVACAGGKVVAAWPDGTPPAWFSPPYANVVAQTSFGETPRMLRKGEFPFGCNIAFRKEIFLSLGGFDESLGKRGKNNIWGEEIDLCHRLQQEGFLFFYNPRAMISHVVGRSRATRQYFVESVFGKGVTEGYQKLTHRGKAVFSAYLLLKAARLATTSTYYLLAGSFLSEASQFQLRCKIAWYTGYLHFLSVRDDLGALPTSSEADAVPDVAQSK